MRLLFERTGGFAGMKLQRAFDFDELPPGDAKQLDALVRKARFFDLPPHLKSPSPGPDRFHYKLTIENEAGIRTVEASEACVPDEMRPLIDWLTRFSRA